MSFAVVLATVDRIVAASDSRAWNDDRTKYADDARKVEIDDDTVFLMTGHASCLTAWRATEPSAGEAAEGRSRRVIATCEELIDPSRVERLFTFGVLRYRGAAADAYLCQCRVAPSAEPRVELLQGYGSPPLSIPLCTTMGWDAGGKTKDALISAAHAELKRHPTEAETISIATEMIVTATTHSVQVGGPIHLAVVDPAGSRWL